MSTPTRAFFQSVVTDDLPFQFQPHAVRLLDALARDADELEHVRGGGAVRVDEPVGVDRRALGAAHPRPLEPGGLDEASGEVTGRVLEHGAGVRNSLRLAIT